MLLLVVDDDALSRDVLTLLLEEEGYEVQVAASGEAAVSHLAASAAQNRTFPDVVLTDIQMPGLAGDALARALKRLLPEGAILLAMSGSRPASAALLAFDGFLLKPFPASELRVMISGKAEPVAEAAEHPETGLSKVEPSARALDEEIYAKMTELMPVAQLGQMYALCLGDARKRIAHMHSLAAEGDDAQYRSEAHAVKGGCGMIGATELYQLAGAAEQVGLSAMAASPGTGSVTDTLTQLSRACDRLERILLQLAQE